MQPAPGTCKNLIFPGLIYGQFDRRIGNLSSVLVTGDSLSEVFIGTINSAREPTSRIGDISYNIFYYYVEERGGPCDSLPETFADRNLRYGPAVRHTCTA